MVAAVDAYRHEELFRFFTGRAPEGLVMHPDGKRLFVQNFMDRTVSVHDLIGAHRYGCEPGDATCNGFDRGDRDAQRASAARQAALLRCARWTAREGVVHGLRVVPQRRRSGRTHMGLHGLRRGCAQYDHARWTRRQCERTVHWTGNFDEIQDFEGQIRSFVLGLGLMSDASFHTGTRSQPLGDPKAGLSPDLDALAAYLGSLATVPRARIVRRTARSLRRATRARTSSSRRTAARVMRAHVSRTARSMFDTTSARFKAASGSRMNGVLDGFDAPTLRGLWATAPYLHDGSAATLGDAIDAHADVSLSAAERSDLADYLLQIDASESTALRSIPHLEVLTVAGVSSATWTPVPLASRYTSLVAACTIHQSVNTTPQVIRMRQVAADRIELRLQSPEGRTLAGEKLYCLVAEEGKWLLPNGRKFEARRYQSTRVDRSGSWQGEQRAYLQSFTSPVVFGQVMSYNDTRWSTFWARGSSVKNPPSGSALYTGYMVGEDSATTRASETIGYLVFESGSGTFGTIPYEVKVGADTVRGWDNSSTGYAYTFGRSFTGPRVVLATQVGMDGADGSFAIIRGNSGVSATAVRLIADEDNVRDTERSHSAEQVSYFVIDQPTVITLTPAP